MVPKTVSINSQLFKFNNQFIDELSVPTEKTLDVNGLLVTLEFLNGSTAIVGLLMPVKGRMIR